MIVMGVDYGAARTGVAVSDPSGFLARGLEILHIKSARKTAKAVALLAKQNEAGIIIVGMPKNMDNSIGERGEATLRFIELLKRECPCEIHTWDERLSTVSAAGYLNAVNIRGDKRKAVIDAVAAEIILQGWLDRKRAVE